ncbi:hypothetical protein COE58_01160 [Bacillus cereus]|nr:hypothetical protein COE58_01160 [Bacillus cereus]
MSINGEVNVKKQQLNIVLEFLRDFMVIRFHSMEHIIFTIDSYGISMGNVEGYKREYFTFFVRENKFKITVKESNGKCKIKRIENIE